MAKVSLLKGCGRTFFEKYANTMMLAPDARAICMWDDLKNSRIFDIYAPFEHGILGIYFNSKTLISLRENSRIGGPHVPVPGEVYW